WPEVDVSPDHQALFDQLLQLQSGIDNGLKRFSRMFIGWLVLCVPPGWLLGLLLLAAFATILAALQGLGVSSSSWLEPVEIGLAALMVVRLIVRQLANHLMTPVATSIAGALAKVRRLLEVCFDKAQSHFQQEEQRIKTQFDDTTQRLDQEWKDNLKE